MKVKAEMCQTPEVSLLLECILVLMVNMVLSDLGSMMALIVEGICCHNHDIQRFTYDIYTLLL